MPAADIASHLGLAVVALLAAARVRSARAQGFRPVVLALAVTLALDLARHAAATLVLAVEPRPFVGWARAVFYADTAAALAFPAVSASLAITVYARRRAWLAGVALLWAGALGYIVARYPEHRGAAITRVHLAAHLASVGAQLGVGVVFAFRHGWPGIRGEARPEQEVVLILLAGDLAALAGPWLAGTPVQDWWLGQWVSAATYAVLALSIASRLRSRG